MLHTDLTMAPHAQHLFTRGAGAGVTLHCGAAVSTALGAGLLTACLTLLTVVTMLNCIGGISDQVTLL